MATLFDHVPPPGRRDLLDESRCAWVLSPGTRCRLRSATELQIPALPGRRTPLTYRLCRAHLRIAVTRFVRYPHTVTELTTPRRRGKKGGTP